MSAGDDPRWNDAKTVELIRQLVASVVEEELSSDATDREAQAGELDRDIRAAISEWRIYQRNRHRNRA